MRQPDLRGVDANLLVPLDALLEHRNVTRAAAAVGMSQPAMSRALGRLRALLRDPLLARGAEGLVPTPRARALHPRLKRALAEIGAMVADAPFEPARATGRFTLAATDHQTIMLLPRLMRRLSREAPKLDLTVVPFLAASIAGLSEGRIDLAFGVAEEEGGLPRALRVRALYRDRFVTVLREGHPALARWSLETFVGLDHVLVTVMGEGRGAVDAALAERGLVRRVALRLPHFYAAIGVVAATDLAVTLPASIAGRYAAAHGLAAVDPPVRREPFTAVAIWSEVVDADPAHRWVRGVVAEEARDVEGAIPLSAPAG